MTSGLPVKIDYDGGVVRTHGLRSLGHYDFRVKVIEDRLVKEAKTFAQYMVDYQLGYNAQILPDQTVTYGFWTVKFVRSNDELLDVWEFSSDVDSGTLVVGANYALRCWRVQRDLCTAFGVKHDPPHAAQMAYISDGVLDGQLPLEGVRYPSISPKTGWFLTTSKYNGDIRTLRQVHLYHVTSRCPELISVFGLPKGYRFCLQDKKGRSDVWFDEKVATESPI